MALRCAEALPLHQPLEVSVLKFPCLVVQRKLLPYGAALPLADTAAAITLPLVHFTDHVQPNNLYREHKNCF
jgi:hypothetical protein